MSVTLTCSKVNQCHLFTDIKRNNTDQQVLKVKYLDSFKVDPWRYAYINKCMVPFGVRVWNRKPKIEGFRSWITHGCKKWWLDFKKVTEQRPNFLIEGYFFLDNGSKLNTFFDDHEITLWPREWWFIDYWGSTEHCVCFAKVDNGHSDKHRHSDMRITYFLMFQLLHSMA